MEVMEDTMEFLQLTAFSLMAMEAALLRLLEEIAGGTLTVASTNVLKEVSTLMKHALRCVLTMKTKLKDMTLHRPVPKKKEAISTEGIRWHAILETATVIDVCHSSKLLTTL